MGWVKLSSPPRLPCNCVAHFELALADQTCRQAPLVGRKRSSLPELGIELLDSRCSKRFALRRRCARLASRSAAQAASRDQRRRCCGVAARPQAAIAAARPTRGRGPTEEGRDPCGGWGGGFRRHRRRRAGREAVCVSVCVCVMCCVISPRLRGKGV